MKKYIIRFVSLLLLACGAITLFSACTIQPGYEGAPKGMRPINEGEEGAILYVPMGWSVETSTGVPTAYYSSNDRSMITLVRVSAQEAGEVNAQQYWESYREVFAAELKDFAIVKASEDAKDYTTRLIAEQPTYIYDFTAKITNLSYKFRQAVLKHPETGDIYLITYSALTDLFDSHLDALDDAYDNFRFVNEKIPMKDTTGIITPDTNGIDIPDGYKLISNDFVDYYFFVPSDWTPTVTTGMTAASAPGGNITVNVMAFEFTMKSTDESDDKSTDNSLDSLLNKSLNDYWKKYEADLISTFGAVTFADPENKFTEADFDGYKGRLYTYSITHNSKTNKYSQYITINGGYIYLVTFSADVSVFDSNTQVFDAIFDNFRFKK